MLRVLQMKAYRRVMPRSRCHPTDDLLEQYVRRMLPEDKDREVEEHYFLCEACQSRAEQIIIFRDEIREGFAELGQPDRRSAERNRSEGTVAVRGVGVAGSGEATMERLLDVSDSGVALQMAAPLEQGHLLRIRLGTGWRRATVKNCIAIDSHFRVGLQFD